MNYVSLVLTLINGLSTLIVWLHTNKAISDHDKIVLAAALEKQSLVIKGAVEAREAQSTTNSATPKSDSLPDDGFRRD
jgi:hypothetical protein